MLVTEMLSIDKSISINIVSFTKTSSNYILSLENLIDT